MHRYRVYGLFVDAPLADADAAVTFWSAALGAVAEAGEYEFTRLADALPGLVMEVQAIDDQPRYHLDIETDDVAAETARLSGLGATVVARHDGYDVLRAPGGQLLCVVPVQSDAAFFAAHARTVG